MAEQSTEEQLRAHIEKWRKGPGFNHGPIDELREQIAWLSRRVDEVREAAAITKALASGARAKEKVARG